MNILALTLALALAAFGWPEQSNSFFAAHPQSRDESQATDDDDIREAVFRYQFKHNASGQQQGAKVYFLSLGKDKDPGNELMERFKGHKPPVKKVSQAAIDMREGVRDKETGESGLIFNVTDIKRVNEDEAEVAGGYYEAGLSSSGNVYQVKREGGKWVVKKDRMLWIS